MNKIMLFACTFFLGVLSLSFLQARNIEQYDNAPIMNEENVSMMGENVRGERYARFDDIRGKADENGYYQEGDIDPNCAYQSGPCVCYCPVTRFKPCYYCTNRYEKEYYPCYKNCYRYVPQYYQKQCCRYVPQYYCQTCCRYVKECYKVCEQKCRTKCCKDWHCRYVPYTCVEKRCMDNCPTPACCPAPTCCPAPACCPTGGCPVRG